MSDLLTESRTSPRPSVLRRLLTLLCLVGLVAVLGTGGAWLWQRQQRRVALETARKGDFSQAAPLLEKLLTRDPTDSAVLEALAQGYLETEDRTNARRLLDQWCACALKDPTPFRLRLTFRKQQAPSEALADGLHLLELVPNDLDLHRQVAGLYFATGAFSQAEAACRACLEGEPDDPPTIRLLAETLCNLGKPQEATELIEDLLKRHPGDPATLMSRASLYRDAQQPAEAIPLLETVLKIDPRRQRTGRYQLALAYEQAGRKEDAQRVLAELRAMQEAEVLHDALLQPDNPDVQLRTARAFLNGGNLLAAFDLIGQVLERRPDDPEAHLLLGSYYEQVGQPERAAEARRRARGPS